MGRGLKMVKLRIPGVPFSDLPLSPDLLNALAEHGPEQASLLHLRAITEIIQGRDLLATEDPKIENALAFLLPIIHNLQVDGNKGGPQALFIAPRIKRVEELHQLVSLYTRKIEISHFLVHKEVKTKDQIKALGPGIEILSATPEALLKLHAKGHLDFSSVRYLVIEKTDVFLKKDNAASVRRLLNLLPSQKQTVISAGKLNEAVLRMAEYSLRDPLQVDNNPPAPAPKDLNHSVYFVEKRRKRHLLIDLFFELNIRKGLVFVRNSDAVKRIIRPLKKAGIRVEALCSDRSTENRDDRSWLSQRFEEVSSAKSENSVDLLLTTDRAVKGLNLKEFSHVISYNLPKKRESYQRRISHAAFDSFSIVLCDETEKSRLSSLESDLDLPILRIRDHRFHHSPAEPPEIKISGESEAKAKGRPTEGFAKIRGVSEQKDSSKNRKRFSGLTGRRRR